MYRHCLFFWAFFNSRDVAWDGCSVHRSAHAGNMGCHHHTQLPEYSEAEAYLFACASYDEGFLC